MKCRIHQVIGIGVSSAIIHLLNLYLQEFYPLFKKNNKEIKLETSREIEQRIEKPKFSTSVMQYYKVTLLNLLTVSEGRRDQKWIEDLLRFT